jgi:hypothetical protein
MKRLLCLIVIAVIVISCSKEDSNPQTTTGQVTIKGTISAVGAKKINKKKGADPVSIADAKKVMIFEGSQYTISNIVDSSFTISADEGTANALVFLNADNKFIGVLCTQGLYVLPLVGLKDSENTIIDLQKLTMPGDSIIPMHNPFGTEINLSFKEIESLKAVGSYYKSLAENIDADNNGELDILVNKQISLTFHFLLYIGKMGVDNTLPTAVNEQNLFINYFIELSGGKALGDVSNSSKLIGPIGNESSDIKLWGFANTVDSKQSFLISFIREGNVNPGNPLGNNFLPFEKGIYTFTPYSGTSYNLNFSNVDARDNLIIISPTLKTDGNGKILSVEFKYTLTDGTSINPEKLISDFMIQFIDTEDKQFLIVRPVAEHGFYKFTFQNPVNLSTLKGMGLFYYDLLGNYYTNTWLK